MKIIKKIFNPLLNIMFGKYCCLWCDYETDSLTDLVSHQENCPEKP